MNALFPVMAGGAIGAGLRYVVGLWLAPRGGFPVATFCVNLIGGFVMGLITAALLRGHIGEMARLFIGVGILGGFTTFSAFSLESYQMLERGQVGLAISYVAASVVGSLVALALGYGIMR